VPELDLLLHGSTVLDPGRSVSVGATGNIGL